MPDTFLRDLADSLGRAIADNGGGFLVHVAESEAGPDVGVLPLDGVAPAEFLLGTRAPDHWSVLGTAVRAQARPLSGRGAATAADVVVLVPRRGPVVGRLRQGDRVITEPPRSGVTLDCLRRALTLPTPPPETPVIALLAITWLERVLAAGPRRRLTWPEVQALHPAWSMSEELERAFEWGRMRNLVIEGKWPEASVTAEEAEWFDVGSFSRWVLGQHPPLAVLVDQLPRVVGRSTAHRCVGALQRWGIQAAA